MLCPNLEFQEKLYSFLQENVIRLSHDDIYKIYACWREGFDIFDFQIPPDVKIINDKNRISDSQKIPENACMLGIDFPIWFNTAEDKRRIMILGIDPLRNQNTFKAFSADKTKQVIIGTPYGLSSANGRKGRQKNYWNLISSLAEKNFVYLTDIYKTFFYINEGKKERSYDYFQQNDISKEHKELLQKEIDLIKPDLIITFGNISYSQLMTVRPPELTRAFQSYPLETFTAISGSSEIPVLPMVHLSAWEKSKRDFLTANQLYDSDIVTGYLRLINKFLEETAITKSNTEKLVI